MRKPRLFKSGQIVAPAGATAEAWQAYSAEAASLAAKAGRYAAQGNDEDGGEMTAFQQPTTT